MSNTLFTQLAEHIDACFTGLWVHTHEPHDALREIARLCHDNNWQLAVWDIDRGLQFPGRAGGTPALPIGSDPVAILRSLPALGNPESSALLVLRNFHRFLGNTEIIQTLEHQLIEGKTQRTFVLILSPIVQIPVELEKQFVVLEHELPDRPQLEQIALGVATLPEQRPDEPSFQAILEAASGLTRSEAESAFALSLVRHDRLELETLWELKEQMLKKSGLLTLHRGTESFSNLGGLAALKTFCRKALQQREAVSRHAQPRGILLLSAPGCGKSAFCKALGRETGRPTLILDVGTLLGGVVGQTEQNVRQALRIIDAMGPCIVMLDEVDKALSGVGHSVNDSGVSARLFGTLLAWLSDHDSDAFVVCTANDVQKLPPEFSRAERFDGVFFLDLPRAEERQAIWNLYRPQFGLDHEQPLPNDTDWTGAEIRACCRLAALLDLSLVEAARQIVPIARTAHEAVDKLRTWASGRCLSADVPGIYRREAAPSRSGRKINRPNPSNN